MDVSTVNAMAGRAARSSAEAVDELGCHVLRIGRTAAVTAQQELVALAEAFHQATANFVNGQSNTAPRSVP